MLQLSGPGQMALRTLGKIKFSVTESKDTLCPLLYHSPSKSPVRTAQSYPYTMVLKLQETLDYQKQPSYSAGRKRGPRGCPAACRVGSAPRVCRGAQPEAARAGAPTGPRQATCTCKLGTWGEVGGGGQEKQVPGISQTTCPSPP